MVASLHDGNQWSVLPTSYAFDVPYIEQGWPLFSIKYCRSKDVWPLRRGHKRYYSFCFDILNHLLWGSQRLCPVERFTGEKLKLTTNSQVELASHVPGPLWKQHLQPQSKPSDECSPGQHVTVKITQDCFWISDPQKLWKIRNTYFV